MSRFTDQQYLKTNQYKDATNLNARLTIHERFSTNPYGWFNWVFDTLVRLPENARILELGCGPAVLWKSVSNRIPSGWDISLSDLSSGMVDAAWRNLVVTGHAFKFKEIDTQSIPFEDETFDAVIANHMLYHVPDRQKAIAEIKRVLKLNGRLIATTVSENHMSEITKWLQRASTDKNFDPFVLPFTLENGLEQLQAFFSEVTISHYEDNLHVTEIEPLIAYIRSAIRTSELSEEEVTKVQFDLEEELKDKGGIFFSKDSSLFEAVK